MPRKPYKWDSSNVKIAEVYISSSRLPTVRGLSSLLGVSRETIYSWARAYVPFGEALSRLHSVRSEIKVIHE